MSSVNPSPIYHPAALAFGLHGCSCQKKKDANWKQTGAALTLFNIISWIPIIGAIIGAFRVYQGIQGYRETPKDMKGIRQICQAVIARGIAAIVGLGPLLMIIDIVIAIARKCIPHPSKL
jgi:hypothetical protein